MLVTRYCLALALLVGLTSCFTCYRCHNHDARNCFPITCNAGQACIIHSAHGNGHQGHVTLPQTCENATECEMTDCCFDDDCVEKVMIAAHAQRRTTTQHLHTTQNNNVQSTTIAPFICKDEVYSLTTNCHMLASSGECQKQIGVQICKDTCGFCDYVRSTFGEAGFCKDKLINNNCASLNICADALAIELCPKTCGLCASKMHDVMKDFLLRTTTTSTTTTTTTTTTTAPCVDQIENNGCASLPGVCGDKIAHDVCPRFCNVCG